MSNDAGKVGVEATHAEHQRKTVYFRVPLPAEIRSDRRRGSAHPERMTGQKFNRKRDAVISIKTRPDAVAKFKK
jgi:hypothetical protein